MEATTPPLLTLDEDCLVLIAEAVAAIDLKLPKECVAGSKSSAMRIKPVSLLNFSMVNKNVRRMISSVVFRNAFLLLGEHYQSDFQRGKGATPCAQTSGEIVYGIKFPQDLIGHTRTLSLQCQGYFSGYDLSVDDGMPTVCSHTTLTTLDLFDLLQAPRALKRLNIDKLPQCLLNEMRSDATVVGMQQLTHVQELAICIPAAYIIRHCPNTVTLYVTEANWPDYTSFFDGDDNNATYRDEFCRYSSALTRLRSLQLGRAIPFLSLSDLHTNLSQLEHFYLEEGDLRMNVWPPTSDNTNMITAGFPRLRTFTVHDVLNYKMLLRDGRDLWDTVGQHGRYMLTREDKDLLSLARFELAEDLLYSGHPTLEAVYMPVHTRASRKAWLPEGHQKFVKCGGQRRVKVESFEIKSLISTLHWKSQPAITK